MREDTLTNILSQLNSTSADIQASAVISIDGLMMAALLPAGLDQDRMGAMSAALLSLGARWAPTRSALLGCDAGHEKRTASGALTAPLKGSTFSCFGQISLQ